MVHNFSRDTRKWTRSRNTPDQVESRIFESWPALKFHIEQWWQLHFSDPDQAMAVLWRKFLTLLLQEDFTLKIKGWRAGETVSCSLEATDLQVRHLLSTAALKDKGQSSPFGYNYLSFLLRCYTVDSCQGHIFNLYTNFEMRRNGVKTWREVSLWKIQILIPDMRHFAFP